MFIELLLAVVHFDFVECFSTHLLPFSCHYENAVEMKEHNIYDIRAHKLFTK